MIWKPGWWPTVPCSGGRRTTQNPTSDVLLYVRTGRRVLSKDELAALISSDVFAISLSRSLFILSLQFAFSTFAFYFLPHLNLNSQMMSVAPSKNDNQSEGSAIVQYTKVKGVDLQQNQADIQTVDIINILFHFFSSLSFLCFSSHHISYHIFYMHTAWDKTSLW